jgi:hypothetical protein
VTSLVLEPADEQSVVAALPGQFLVLRFGPASAPALNHRIMCGIRIRVDS